MTNSFYNPSGNPGTGAPGSSLIVRNEFTSISTAFNYFPAFTGNSGKALIVNAPGTAYDLTTGALALGGNLTITGANSTNFVAAANVNLTLPIVDGTLALLASPAFTGNPTSPTPSPGDNDTSIATTAFVVTSFAPLASPVLTGNPTAPTPSPGDNDTSIATTAFVVTSFAPLASPSLTGNPTAPTPASGDNDTSIATTAFVVADRAVTTQAAADNVGRNLLDNSLFNIWQRGASFSTNSVYTADRWLLLFNLDTGVAVAQTTLTDAIRAAIGDEAAATALQTAFTGNAGAASFTFVTQPIEDVRRLSGKTVTVSFWAWSAAGTPKVGVSLDQNFGTGGSPSATVTGNGQAVTLSTTQTRYSLTFTIPSASGKTLGTVGDSKTALIVWLSSGTTQATRAGSIGVQSGTVALWGMQLEVGSVMTPLDYGGSPQQQFAQCQRFYQANIVQIQGSVYVANGFIATTLGLPTQMRALPTLVPTWAAPTNAFAPSLTALSGSAILASCQATAAGLVVQQGSFTASADL